MTKPRPQRQRDGSEGYDAPGPGFVGGAQGDQVSEKS